ncbi:MAG: GDYXXLXY domain-containing protein [Proteobacteria bacterium]|nr:GDYXXLXY domain-containing protein [Pseudomonadota bacterium]
MKKNIIVIGIAIAVFFQISVLVGEYVSASVPLWFGREIRLKTIPVDPRSMFRGNYALLNYDISRIDEKKFPGYEDLRNGEIVYIHLVPVENGLYGFEKVSLASPESGVFIRGRIQNRRWEEDRTYFRIKYGIEAYFAPKEKALALEKDLAEGGIAVILISDSGKAALKEVVPNLR